MPDARAILIIAASETDSNLYYATRFIAPDPFIYLELCEGPPPRNAGMTGSGERLLVMSDLELDRARSQASVDRVLSYSELEQGARTQGDTDPGPVDVVHQVLQPAGVKQVLVPGNFPFVHARRLQQLGYELETKKEPFFEHRALKSDEEVGYIEASQRATEQAVAAAHEAVQASVIRGGVLWLESEPLTSERLKKLINVRLMEQDCVAQHTIVAGGEQACDPHHEGSGPLPAHRSIIFDVFPRSGRTRYFADMSRTIVKGRPSAELARLYQTVRDAQEEAISQIRDGADGAKIHRRVCERFESAGYRTGLVNGRMQGYFHGTGHGVGLDIHESPRISRTGSVLKEGHVVTVEPGLYFPGLGAARIEDMVLVTRDGCRNLTDYPKKLELE